MRKESGIYKIKRRVVGEAKGSEEEEGFMKASKGHMAKESWRGKASGGAKGEGGLDLRF